MTKKTTSKLSECAKCPTKGPTDKMWEAFEGSDQVVCDSCFRLGLKAEADLEYKTRVQADRVTAAWSTPIIGTLATFEDSPLFGGARQLEMF